MKKKVIIIGSGLGGLAVACRLAARGYNVIIFEKNNIPGGCCSGFERNGYQFSNGPLQFPNPYLLDELFEYIGFDRKDYLTLSHIEPVRRFFNKNGQNFDFPSNFNDISQQVEKFDPADLDGLIKFSNTIAFKDKTKEIPLYFHKTLASIQDQIQKPFSDTLFKTTEKCFQNPFLQQIFGFSPLAFGNNPLIILDDYLINQSFGDGQKMFSIDGGIHQLTNILTELFQKFGGQIEYHAEVKEIIFQENQAQGVRFKNDQLHFADFIISNMDAYNTFEKLIPINVRKPHTTQIDSSASLFSINIGLRKKLKHPQLLHQNILMPRNLRRFIGQIFTEKSLSGDFLLFINIPTRLDSNLAPVNGDILQIHSLVPDSTAEIEWKKISRSYRNRIIRFLERHFSLDIKTNTRIEFVYTPNDYEEKFAHLNGSPFSAQLSRTQSGNSRLRNKCSPPIKNLYLVGGGTNPGPGIPGVLESARITEYLIKKDYE
ncbi:MAG: phytoene desaturase [Anaerolineaceae bacterium]|nr:phytoene desaturase [Anaerolineaceae bacterium]